MVSDCVVDVEVELFICVGVVWVWVLFIDVVEECVVLVVGCMYLLVVFFVE